jgi:hypothetical protein
MSITRMVRLDRCSHGGRLLAAGVVALLLCPPLAAAQPAAGPFTKFDGSWRGSGQVIGSDGKHEKISCRAHYSIPPSGNALSQSLICASDSYRFEVQSDVVATDGHSVQGTWRSGRSGLGRPVPRQRLGNRLYRGNIPENERRQTIGDHRPAGQQHRQSRYCDVAGRLNRERAHSREEASRAVGFAVSRPTAPRSARGRERSARERPMTIGTIRGGAHSGFTGTIARR